MYKLRFNLTTLSILLILYCGVSAAVTERTAKKAGSEKAFESSLETETVDLEGRSFFLWLPGSMGWPELRMDVTAPRSRQLQTLRTLVLQNNYLSARFLPEIGLRLYDLSWNDDPLQRQAFDRQDSGSK